MFLCYWFVVSIGIKGFAGFKPNCIYFTKQFGLDYAFKEIGDNGGCIFNLEDKEFGNSTGYSQMFWPWFCPSVFCFYLEYVYLR